MLESLDSRCGALKLAERRLAFLPVIPKNHLESWLVVSCYTYVRGLIIDIQINPTETSGRVKPVQDLNGKIEIFEEPAPFQQFIKPASVTLALEIPSKFKVEISLASTTPASKRSRNSPVMLMSMGMPSSVSSTLQPADTKRPIYANDSEADTEMLLIPDEQAREMQLNLH